MSNPGIRIEDHTVTIYDGEAEVTKIDMHDVDEVTGVHLQYANLIMLQAVVERQSALADATNAMAMALQNLVELSKERAQPPDLDAVMGKASDHIAKMLSGTGLRMPGQR